MSTCSQIRHKMVVGQLEPSGIIEPEILNVFEVTPRECFLPPDQRAKAYSDEDIVMPGCGAALPEPLISARMIQMAKPCSGDVVLNIGDRTGYISALLSPLVSTVMTVDMKNSPARVLLEQARAVWQDMALCNIAVLQGDGGKGMPEHGPYSLIFINGAVAEIPETILAQLTPGGRLVTVLKDNAESVGHLMLIEKQPHGELRRTIAHEAQTPYLDGFRPETKFIF